MTAVFLRRELSSRHGMPRLPVQSGRPAIAPGCPAIAPGCVIGDPHSVDDLQAILSVPMGIVGKQLPCERNSLHTPKRNDSP